VNGKLFQKDQHNERNEDFDDAESDSGQDVETMIMLLNMAIKILEKHR